MKTKIKVLSEGPTRITKATIESAWRKRKAEQRVVIRDSDCRGLALIVNPTAMAWSYAYRPRGLDPTTGKRFPNKSVTIGNPATHSPEDARLEANAIKGQAAAGTDPAAEKKAKAEVARQKRGATLSRLLERYEKALPRRPKMRGAGLPSKRYVDGEVGQIRLAIADMEAQDLPVADLGPTELRKLIDRDGSSASARGRFGAMSRFLDWCQEEGHVAVNPCNLIGRSRRPKAPKAREHYLSPAEVARIWKAAEELEHPVWRDVVRFLAVVPCRRSEAARLAWSELDLVKKEWRQPGQITKNREPHRLHLHSLAIEVLYERRKAYALSISDGDKEKAAKVLAANKPIPGLVFPAPVSAGAVDTFSDLKAAVTAASKTEDENGTPIAALTGWTWHDFRRSFATALGEEGLSETVVDAVLNHRQSATRSGVLGVYQRATRWPEQVRAMDRWGAIVDAAINPPPANADGEPDNVVRLTERAI